MLGVCLSMDRVLERGDTGERRPPPGLLGAGDEEATEDMANDPVISLMESKAGAEHISVSIMARRRGLQGGMALIIVPTCFVLGWVLKEFLTTEEVQGADGRGGAAVVSLSLSLPPSLSLSLSSFSLFITSQLQSQSPPSGLSAEERRRRIELIRAKLTSDADEGEKQQ